MNEIHIFSRFTIFQHFSFYFLIFKHARTYLFFCDTHMDCWFRISLSFSIMHNTNKIQHKKAFIHMKPTLTSTVLHSLYQKPLHSNFIHFCTIFTTRLNSKTPFHPHFTYFHRRIFTLALLLYFAWFDSNKLIFTCSSVLTICIHTTYNN